MAYYWVLINGVFCQYPIQELTSPFSGFSLGSSSFIKRPIMVSEWIFNEFIIRIYTCIEQGRGVKATGGVWANTDDPKNRAKITTPKKAVHFLTILS